MKDVNRVIEIIDVKGTLPAEWYLRKTMTADEFRRHRLFSPRLSRVYREWSDQSASCRLFISSSQRYINDLMVMSHFRNYHRWAMLTIFSVFAVSFKMVSIYYPGTPFSPLGKLNLSSRFEGRASRVYLWNQSQRRCHFTLAFSSVSRLRAFDVIAYSFNVKGYRSLSLCLIEDRWLGD